ncbi:MAG TPA: hypothetical protein VK698_26475 [Kofleriaceae bacterium]|nr:hypothetical protein [Kofleriaceae bacterium]
MKTGRGVVLAVLVVASGCMRRGSYQVETYRGARSDIGARCAADCGRAGDAERYTACLAACPGVRFYEGYRCPLRGPGPDCLDECHATTTGQAEFGICEAACRARPAPEPAVACRDSTRFDGALLARTLLGATVGGLVLWWAFWQLAPYYFVDRS